jgi:thiamine-monophosphate kinase
MRPGVLVGPGDDAAVIEAADGRVVATTDLLVEGRHFRRDWATAHQVGARAAAANLADVAAMGAVPTALLVGLALPGDTAVDWVVELADGLAAEAGVVGAGVVGGDVVSAPLVVVSGTALGDLQGRPPVTRAGARSGDTVALAGRLGWAAAGLHLRRAGVGTGEEGTGEDWVPALLDAYARPVVWYDEGLRAAAAGAHALCDVSDGLLADLGHIAAASGVQV